MSNIYDSYSNPLLSKQPKPRRLIVIVVAVLVVIVALIVLAIFNSIRQSEYSASVSLLFAPTSSDATLNGQEIKAGKTDLKPGNYKLVIEKSGFKSNVSSFNLEAGQTKTIVIALISNDPNTANWYSEHEEDAAILDKVGAREAGAAEETIQSNFTIANILPITSFNYKIDYIVSPDKPGSYAVIITGYTRDAKDEAIKQLQSLGYDTSKYEIIYKDKSS